MLIDVMDLQDKIQDSMLEQKIPESELERAIDMVHEKVAVLIYCAQRIEHAIKGCQEWEGANDTYINGVIQDWLRSTCKTVDLDKLHGVNVKVFYNKDREQDPITLNIQYLYTDNSHLSFESEHEEHEQSMAAC